jgi:hypothetical protein
MKLAYGVYKLKSFHQIGRYFFDQLLKKWAFMLLMSLTVYAILSYIDDPLSTIWKNNNGKDCPNAMWQIWFAVRNLQLDCKVCLPWFWLLQS